MIGRDAIASVHSPSVAGEQQFVIGTVQPESAKGSSVGKNSSSAKAVPLKPDSARLLLRSERRQCYHRTGSSLLNLINPHVGDARLSESKRHRGLRRNVDHSATDARAPANDRDDDAKAVVEVDDTDLRPHRQAAMRRTTMHVGRNARPFPTACSLPKTRGAKRAQASSTRSQPHQGASENFGWEELPRPRSV